MKSGTLILAIQYEAAPAALQGLHPVLGDIKHQTTPARPKAIAYAYAQHICSASSYNPFAEPAKQD